MSATIHTLNPPTVWTVPEGFRNVYSHAAVASDTSKMLFVSGQFGVRPDGSLPATFPEQAAQAMVNVEAILDEAGMSFANVVKLNFFLTRDADAPDLVKLRAEKWGSTPPPAVTVLTVSALAKPAYLIEIEAIALA